MGMGFLGVSPCMADSPPTNSGFIVTTIFLTEMGLYVQGLSGLALVLVGVACRLS